MTGPILEPRSFNGDERRDLKDWPEQTIAWDAVSSRALVQRVRWHTGLSQIEFADVFGIDLGHLRALERGAVQPERALVAYLTVIDCAPDTVRAALRTS
jgi:putative transcriptional regulator